MAQGDVNLAAISYAGDVRSASAPNPATPARNGGSLRQRILAFVGGLIILSLLGSIFSLYRITEVSSSLDAINRVAVPLGKLLAQLQSDAEAYRRESDRRLGFSHWSDPHWKARLVPRWVEEVIEGEISRAQELLKRDVPWSQPQQMARFKTWLESVSQGFHRVRETSKPLYDALERKDMETAARAYNEWNTGLEEWIRSLQWGADEYDRSVRQLFSQAESRVAELRTGLEIILVVVISLSLLLMWLGERALRPLAELTRMAREITRRGLKREDKAQFPEIPLQRTDEVSQLAREFYRMATALLEREKEVDAQRSRLQEQNALLQEMGELNQTILNSIRSILIVTDLEGRIAQCNPGASQWLGLPSESLIGTLLISYAKIQALPRLARALLPEELKALKGTLKIDRCSYEGRHFGGQLMPLGGGSGRQSEGQTEGMILFLEDLTEEWNLQERLRQAENLAAVGRMSAQVAHEVRNPLHSIGLEAEMAIEQASRLGHPQLKQSLQSILGSVDRLEKITENYLKLSKLSAGKKSLVDLGEVLESALATYAQACETQQVRVDWHRDRASGFWVWGDRDLLEQILGNLFRNALQALQDCPDPRISWSLSRLESGRLRLRISDNGPGISPVIREKLFTPFVTTKAQGTGLGLSFVKKVVEDHGGVIACLDATEGASFEILFPVATQLESSGVELHV